MQSSDSSGITMIHPLLIGHMATLVTPWLARGFESAPDVDIQQTGGDLERGDAQLWCIIEDSKVVGAFLTAVFRDEETKERFLGVYALAGEGLSGWAALLDQTMGKFAEYCLCKTVRFCGRKGWERILPQYRVTGERHGTAVYERAVQ